MSEDKLAAAKAQGQAQFDSIRALVTRLEIAEAQAIDGPDETEAARRWIEEDPLSIQVRSGWYTPAGESLDALQKPAEYEILLCTGGPACRILGDLDEHGEPVTARLEVQDWYTPWTEYHPTNEEDTHAEETLLAYARCFYFGE